MKYGYFILKYPLFLTGGAQSLGWAIELSFTRLKHFFNIWYAQATFGSTMGGFLDFPHRRETLLGCDAFYLRKGFTETDTCGDHIFTRWLEPPLNVKQ